jgi:decaprenylphospho-beta-D-erythro-pentofuranosid-2-ulose 2-reductase
MTQRIVIFGATSAIAHEAARAWAQRGAQLFLVGRNSDKLQSCLDDLRVRSGPQGTAQVHMAVADLDDLSNHAELISQALKRMSGIDVALIAYGSLPDQSACEVDLDLAQRQICTNALSPIHLAGLLGNHMQAQKKGCIAVISSVAGDRGRQSNYIYGSAKGMVSLFLQGLRNRLYPYGVAVVNIKPGFVDTPMTAGFDKKGPLWASAEQVGRGIVKAVDGRKDDVYLPGFWRLIMTVICHVPETLFKRLKL